MKLSIVIPVYNEEQSIKKLNQEILLAMKKVALPYEVIYINDGSSDKSFLILENIAHSDTRIKVIDFIYNFGQTAAMSAGIQYATGDIVMPMDADLQNDPNDIALFIEKIKEGFDVVSGWRKDRKDTLIMRKIPSLVANFIIAIITGVRIHDYGCSMKAYKRDIIQGVNLYGEMHRFIPAYASWHGARVTEIIINHRPRIHGETKYGIFRTFKVILDLIVVKFLSNYMNRPMHFFGGLGFILFILGGLTFLGALYLKFHNAISLIQTPLPVFSAMLIIVGVQLIVMGVIAEILMRVYYESQQKTPYTVKRMINF